MLVVAIVAGVVGLNVIVLVTVFTIVGRVTRARIARDRAPLESEGIVLASGPCRGAVHLRNYVGPRQRAGRAVSLVRRELVLTKSQLATLGGSIAQKVPRAELGRYTVSADGKRLVLATDEPPNATGHVELKLEVADPTAWVAALVDAGARRG
jgi:hypothetical protein